LKKFTQTGTESGARNIIGQGTVIKGDIELQGDFRIDGQLIGSIVSSGRIVIGPSGVVEGTIECQNADISGLFRGSLITRELTSLKGSSVFEGDCSTSKIAIEVGAVFNGKCTMLAAQSEKANE